MRPKHSPEGTGDGFPHASLAMTCLQQSNQNDKFSWIWILRPG